MRGADTHSYTNGYANSYANSNAEADSNATAAPDTASAPHALAVKGKLIVDPPWRKATAHR